MVGNILSENFPSGIFPGGSMMGGNFPFGNFPGGNFPRTVSMWHMYRLKFDTFFTFISSFENGISNE